MENKIKYSYFFYHHHIKYTPLYDAIEMALSRRDYDMFLQAREEVQKLVNTMNESKRYKKPWSVEDFLPDYISRFDYNKEYDSDDWYAIVDLNAENFAKITDYESECG